MPGASKSTRARAEAWAVSREGGESGCSGLPDCRLLAVPDPFLERAVYGSGSWERSRSTRNQDPGGSGATEHTRLGRGTGVG